MRNYLNTEQHGNKYQDYHSENLFRDYIYDKAGHELHFLNDYDQPPKRRFYFLRDSVHKWHIARPGPRLVLYIHQGITRKNEIGVRGGEVKRVAYYKKVCWNRDDIYREHNWVSLDGKWLGAFESQKFLLALK